MKQAVHPNGLSIMVAESLFVEEVPRGFIVSAAGPKDFRLPEEVVVTFEPGGSFPRSRWIDTCSVNGRMVYYRIDDDSHKNAGERYALSAWIRSGEGYLMLRQVEQGIWPSVPRFNLAWNVISGIGG